MITPSRRAVVLAAMAATALTGCGRDPSTTASGEGQAGFAEDALIGVALPQKTSENWVLAEQLFNERLTAQGYQADVQFANAGVTEQQNQISTLVTRGAEVIIVGAIDGEQLGTQLQQAKDAGATVIAYDRMVQNTDAVDYHVSFDSVEIGRLQGQALLDGLAARAAPTPANIELFAGSPDDANARAFFDGAMEVLQPELDAGNLVVGSGQIDYPQVVTPGWKPEEAQRRMDALLTAHYSSASLDAVLSPNDTLARTILTRVGAAGKPLPVITGQDSDVESVRLIMSGEQYCTVDKDTSTQVDTAIEMVNALQAGEEPETNGESDTGTRMIPARLLEPILVTSENAAEVYAENERLAPLTAE